MPVTCPGSQQAPLEAFVIQNRTGTSDQGNIMILSSIHPPSLQISNKYPFPPYLALLSQLSGASVRMSSITLLSFT